MRKKKLTFQFLIFFFGLLGGICAQDSQQTSLPVMLISPLDGNKSLIRSWQPAMGQGISEMLVESLEGSNNKFQVLEPSEATDSQKESDASNSTSTKSGQSNSARPKKTMPGAANSESSEASDSANSTKNENDSSMDSDFTFCGDVMEFTVQTNSTKIGDFISSSPFAGLGGKLATAHVVISWRIIDTATKKIVKRGTATASASGPEFDMADLSTANQQNAQKQTGGNAATAHAKTAGAKTGTTGTTAPPKNNNFAFANNFLGGLNKALGNSPAQDNDNSQADNGSTTKSKQPAKKSPSTNAGGDAAETDVAVISYDNPEFMNSALGKATAEAVTNIIEQLAAVNLPESTRITKTRTAADALKHTAGKVLAFVNNSTVIVSLGSKQGFKNGDQLELYQANDIKDDKGNVVFTDEKLVGEIIIVEAQDEKSLCSYSGDAKVQEGWTVKAK